MAGKGEDKPVEDHCGDGHHDDNQDLNEEEEIVILLDKTERGANKKRRQVTGEKNENEEDEKVKTEERKRKKCDNDGDDVLAKEEPIDFDYIMSSTDGPVNMTIASRDSNSFNNIREVGETSTNVYNTSYSPSMPPLLTLYSSDDEASESKTSNKAAEELKKPGPSGTRVMPMSSGANKQGRFLTAEEWNKPGPSGTREMLMSYGANEEGRFLISENDQQAESYVRAQPDRAAAQPVSNTEALNTPSGLLRPCTHLKCPQHPVRKCNSGLSEREPTHLTVENEFETQFYTDQGTTEEPCGRVHQRQKSEVKHEECSVKTVALNERFTRREQEMYQPEEDELTEEDEDMNENITPEMSYHLYLNSLRPPMPQSTEEHLPYEEMYHNDVQMSLQQQMYDHYYGDEEIHFTEDTDETHQSYSEMDNYYYNEDFGNCTYPETSQNFPRGLDQSQFYENYSTNHTFNEKRRVEIVSEVATSRHASETLASHERERRRGPRTVIIDTTRTNQCCSGSNGCHNNENFNSCCNPGNNMGYSNPMYHTYNEEHRDEMASELRTSTSRLASEGLRQRVMRRTRRLHNNSNYCMYQNITPSVTSTSQERITVVDTSQQILSTNRSICSNNCCSSWRCTETIQSQSWSRTNISMTDVCSTNSTRTCTTEQTAVSCNSPYNAEASQYGDWRTNRNETPVNRTSSAEYNQLFTRRGSSMANGNCLHDRPEGQYNQYIETSACERNHVFRRRGSSMANTTVRLEERTEGQCHQYIETTAREINSHGLFTRRGSSMANTTVHLEERTEGQCHQYIETTACESTNNSMTTSEEDPPPAHQNLSRSSIPHSRTYSDQIDHLERNEENIQAMDPPPAHMNSGRLPRTS